MRTIKAIRESRSISQKNLAESLNVSQSCVAKWESGGIFPRTQLLPKLASILGCTIDDLFADEPDEQRKTG